MKMDVRKTIPAALAAMLLAGGCSVEVENVVEPDENVMSEEVIETINYDEPMANFVEPDEDPIPEPTAGPPAPIGNISNSTTGTGLREDEMMLDDAAATGMTSRVDRSEEDAAH